MDESPVDGHTHAFSVAVVAAVAAAVSVVAASASSHSFIHSCS